MSDDQDGFIVGARKRKKTNEENEKHNINSCIKSLKQYFLEDTLETSNKISETLNFAKNSLADQYFYRSTLWKLCLGYHRFNTNLKAWITDANSHRNNYKKKFKQYNTLKQFTSDPLEQSNKNEWSTFFEDNQLRKLIIIDVNRTFQEKDLFRQTSTKDILVNILYIWSKENSSCSYWQGMNEIIAVIFMALYPYYVKVPNNNSQRVNDLKGEITDIKNLTIEDIYYFFHDINEFTEDLYFLFNSIMKKGLQDIYDKTPYKDLKGRSSHFYEYFNRTIFSEDDKKKNILSLRTDSVVKYKLKETDYDLYLHFMKVEMDMSIFLLKWFRCLFSREFHPNDCLKLWDAILVIEFEDNEGYLALIEFISTAMICYIKEDLLTRDQTGCIRRFSKYPPLESITIIIKLALKHKNIFEDEIKQKNPNKRAIKAKDERIEVVTLPKKEIYNEHMLQQDLPKESPQKDQMQLLTKLEAIHRKYIDLYSVEDSKTLESILKEFKAQLTS